MADRCHVCSGRGAIPKEIGGQWVDHEWWSSIIDIECPHCHGTGRATEGERDGP